MGSDDLLTYILIFVGSVLVSSISQVLLKKSADREYQNVLAQYINPAVLSAYALFFLSTLVTVYAFKYVPLSMGPILESLAYVFVGILGVFVLHEHMTPRAVAGMVLIVVGVIVFSL